METEENKDVHTEHCCEIHGCKYSHADCTVVTKQKKQSFYCEYCNEEPSIEVTKLFRDKSGFADAILALRKRRWEQPSNWTEMKITREEFETISYIANQLESAARLLNESRYYINNGIEIISFLAEEL